MVIPDYHTLMPLVLHFHADGMEHYITDLQKHVAQKLRMTKEQFHQRYANTNSTIIAAKINWPLRRLKKYGFIESPKRGYYQLTQKGLDFLKTNPPAITEKTLREFLNPWPSQYQQEPLPITPMLPTAEIPAEPNIAAAVDAANEKLKNQLLARIMQSEPSFFEQLVIDLLVKMSYGSGLKNSAMAIGKSGDEGLDGIIKQDTLGLDAIYIQAKRWQNVIGRPEIQKFAGALQGPKAKKGIFITTSSFTKEAIAYAANIDSKIILIDAKLLTQLMFDHNIAVSTTSRYELKSIDEHYFNPPRPSTCPS